MNEPTGMSALAKVREAAQNRRFDEAETLLSAILVETPTDAEAHTLSFAIAMQRQDFAVARKRAETALAFLPKNPTFLSNLGAAMMQSGDHETAMGHLDAAIEASPDHFTARRNRGMLYTALGRYTDAANDLKVAVQTEPNRGDAQMAYADALIESGQFETAIAVIREAARLNVGRPIERTYLWGRLMFRMGRFEDARQAFSTVLSADPDQMKYYQAFAAANYHIGAVVDAKRITRAAIEKFPSQTRSTGTPALRVLVLEALGEDSFTTIDRHPVAYSQGNFPTFFPADRIAFTHILADNIENLGDVLDMSEFDVALNNRPVFERIDARGHAERVDRMAAALPIPLVNTPAAVKQATRERNAQRFAKAERFIFPRTIRITHETDVTATRDRILSELEFPVILRPPHTNSGHGVTLVQNEAELSEILRNHPFADFYAIDYHDCQSEDGYFRRYRCACIGDKMLPCGLHIGSGWNVHGEDRGTLDWSGLGFDQEEIAFHEDPSAMLHSSPADFFREITDAIDLDIYGFDFGYRRDGRVIVFEVNSAMGLSLAGTPSSDPYRAAYKAELVNDIETYLFDRAGKSPPADRR